MISIKYLLSHNLVLLWRFFKKRGLIKMKSLIYCSGYFLVTAAYSIGGVGNVLPIFEFFIRFSIGLRWVLQIHLFKYWELEILCIKIWKLKIRRGAALHPTWNDSIFKFRLEDYFILRLMKTTCYSHWMTAPKSCGKCESPRFIGSKQRFRRRLLQYHIWVPPPQVPGNVFQCFTFQL